MGWDQIFASGTSNNVIKDSRIDDNLQHDQILLSLKKYNFR